MLHLPPGYHTGPLDARSIGDALRSIAVPFGCPVGFLQTPRATVVTRTGDRNRVVHTFLRESVAMVSVPGESEGEVVLDETGRRELLELTYIDGVHGSIVEINGQQFEVAFDPPLMLVADNATLSTQVKPASVALAYDPPRTVCDMLQNDVSAHDWSTGGGTLPAAHRVGALAGGALVGMASMAEPEGRLAQIRVVVARSHRRRGVGRVVLHTLAQNALGRGLLPYCRLDDDDLAACSLIADVGFVRFARSLTFRLRTVPLATPAFAS